MQHDVSRENNILVPNTYLRTSGSGSCLANFDHLLHTLNASFLLDYGILIKNIIDDFGKSSDDPQDMVCQKGLHRIGLLLLGIRDLSPGSYKSECQMDLLIVSTVGFSFTVKYIPVISCHQ
jgi:hypothetical protein